MFGFSMSKRRAMSEAKELDQKKAEPKCPGTLCIIRTTIKRLGFQQMVRKDWKVAMGLKLDHD